eukprot:CAMPEP_0181389986 /NCGR_PEP_ID=MMETSP1106-20121128/25229_1 /TAXON_ID=81844 /ORGANISM="Mantoniella antarctica, Strain SL-175" /LENGTH=82 /DNA_ID=CAMNT_0023510837 /DNA_START=202 /DNA_END=450 /DNA_ORIENTATION=+
MAAEAAGRFHPDGGDFARHPALLRRQPCRRCQLAEERHAADLRHAPDAGGGEHPANVLLLHGGNGGGSCGGSSLSISLPRGF